MPVTHVDNNRLSFKSPPIKKSHNYPGGENYSTLPHRLYLHTHPEKKSLPVQPSWQNTEYRYRNKEIEKSLQTERKRRTVVLPAQDCMSQHAVAWGNVTEWMTKLRAGAKSFILPVVNESFVSFCTIINLITTLNYSNIPVVHCKHNLTILLFVGKARR